MMQSNIKKRKILQNDMKNNAKRMHIDVYSHKVISCNGKSLSFYSLSCAVMEIRPLESL